jgi:hypothetical protein
MFYQQRDLDMPLKIIYIYRERERRTITTLDKECQGTHD